MGGLAPALVNGLSNATKLKLGRILLAASTLAVAGWAATGTGGTGDCMGCLGGALGTTCKDVSAVCIADK